MLALMRKRNEKVIITCPDGSEIVVCLLEIRGNKCSLGFEAAREIEIHREEVYDAIERERAEEAGE